MDVNVQLARRGFLPAEDPHDRFGDDSQFGPMDELGRDLPSLLQDGCFRAFAAGCGSPLARPPSAGRKTITEMSPNFRPRNALTSSTSTAWLLHPFNRNNKNPQTFWTKTFRAQQIVDASTN